MAVARYRVKPSPEDVIAAMSPSGHEFTLTRRQAEILFWLSHGLQLPKIGEFMGGVSYNTVKSIAHVLYQRMRVKNAAEAVRVGFETGLLVARVSGTRGVIFDERRNNLPPAAAALRSARGGQPTSEDQRLPGPDGA